MLLASLLVFGCMLTTRGQRYQDFDFQTPLAVNETLVIGFVGGREDWNSEKEGVRRLALERRSLDLNGVYIETVENKRRHLALELVEAAFDRDRNRTLDSVELDSVRLILYGQSFGGAAVVKLSRELQAKNIPVLLTVQIDSVGRNDAVIPPNVQNAANLFQKNGRIIHGEPEITAEDPSKTKILGNFEFDYSNKKIDLSGVPWWKKLFRTDHTKMNRDPEVWGKVEKLILESLCRFRCDKLLRTRLL